MATKVFLIAIAAVMAGGLWLGADAASAGQLVLNRRRRVKRPDGTFAVRCERVTWEAKETALIICDMWDKHWCKGATRRVAEMAPRMNEMISKAREAGALIVHAPSSCMKAYQDHAARKRAQSAPKAKNLPKDIAGWNRKLDAEKGATWPIDQSDGGCDCQPRCKGGGPWRSQIATLEIKDRDAITDSGVETWNVLEQAGIKNVILLGVHTNMCVIGRPFGLRNMVRCGKNVVLVRDLTDTMYNPRKPPKVSHFRGTDLIVAYIEKYVCPTITSSDVTGNASAAFRGDKRPRVVVAVAEKLYQTDRTLPQFAAAVLEDQLGLPVTVLHASGKDGNTIPGLAEALAGADVLILSARRRALPAADIKALRAYLGSGGGLVAIRTSSHAFDTRGKFPPGHAEWREFDAEVLGGHYTGHHKKGPKVTVTMSKGAKGHPILGGVKTPFTHAGPLYTPSPLADSATELLTGSIPGKKAEPVAWVRTYKKSRVFYTSLGHPDDFEDASAVKLLRNAVLWAMDKPIPTKASP